MSICVSPGSISKDGALRVPHTIRPARCQCRELFLEIGMTIREHRLWHEMRRVRGDYPRAQYRPTDTVWRSPLLRSFGGPTQLFRSRSKLRRPRLPESKERVIDGTRRPLGWPRSRYRRDFAEPRSAIQMALRSTEVQVTSGMAAEVVTGTEVLFQISFPDWPSRA